MGNLVYSDNNSYFWRKTNKAIFLSYLCKPSPFLQYFPVFVTNHHLDGLRHISQSYSVLSPSVLLYLPAFCPFKVILSYGIGLFISEVYSLDVTR